MRVQYLKACSKQEAPVNVCLFVTYCTVVLFCYVLWFPVHMCWWDTERGMILPKWALSSVWIQWLISSPQTRTRTVWLPVGNVGHNNNTITLDFSRGLIGLFFCIFSLAWFINPGPIYYLIHLLCVNFLFTCYIAHAVTRFNWIQRD